MYIIHNIIKYKILTISYIYIVYFTIHYKL